MEDFHFNDDGKLYLCYVFKERYTVIKKMHQFFSLNALKLIGKTSYVNGL